MKKQIFIKLLIFTLIIILLSGVNTVEAKKNWKKDSVFQVSTINALFQGLYDGTLSFKKIFKKGDFGLGTLDALNGEVVGFDGEFFQITSKGKVNKVTEDDTTPFMVVTEFEKDQEISVENIKTYKELQTKINETITNKNLIYAIRVEGTFNHIKARSVAAQKKPYPPLLEVVKHQSIFEFNDIKGTFAGFVFPEYLSDLNVTGYHLHFLRADKKAGGHLLECSIKNAVVKIDIINNFSMNIPNSKAFGKMDLTKTKATFAKSLFSN